MYHLPIRRRGSFHHGFAHGWVRVYGFDDFVPCGFEFAGHHGFGDQFRHVGADHVRTQPLAVFFVKNNFHKPFGVAGSFCFSAGGERKLAQ
jgi:hypothetical protein